MKKSLFIFVLAVFFLMGVLWVQKYREEAPRRDGFVFDTTRAAEIRSLRVAYLWDSMELVTVDHRWVTSGDSFPVDTARIRKVLGELLRLKTQEKVSDSADTQGLWDYGLDPENGKRVRWVNSSGDTAKVVLGKTSSLDYSFTYWKWQASPEVYRTPGSFIWDVSPRIDDWREKSLWPVFTSADVQAIVVDWRDASDRVQHYKVERMGDTLFQVTEPVTRLAVRSAAEKLFEKAPQFSADDFSLHLDPNREQSIQSLKARPSIIVRIVLNNGTTHTLKGGGSFDGYQYTQHPRHRNTVWVFKWRYDYFKKTVDDLTIQ